MALTGQNFTRDKGDDFVLQITITDAQSLTGYSAKWFLATSATASAYKIRKLSSDGGITFDANKVLIGFASAETKELASDPLPVGDYYHELHLTDPQGKITCAAKGTFTLTSPFDKRV